MNRHRSLETLVKETLAVEPSPAEREAAWQSVLAQLREDGEAFGRAPERGRARPNPRSLRPARVAALGGAVLAVVLVAVALLPTAFEPGAPMPTASSAEAAAILNATATRTRSAPPVVGPGEYLFARTSLTIPGEGAVVVTKSWTATDGSALIVDRERSSRPCPPRSAGARAAPTSSARRVAPCPRFDTGTTRYRAGSDVGVQIEAGRERPSRPELFDWRAVVPGDEVVRLPDDRDALLALLRARAERAVREQQKRPDPHRKLGGRDLRLAQVELSGLDLVVVEAITDLLVYAPLNPDQRAAMLSLLAEAPDWYRPGRSAQPIQIRKLGPTEDALGRDGTAVQIATHLTEGEAGRAGDWAVDLVLDPDAGRLLEIRSYEHGLNAAPIPLTVEAQRVADSIRR